MIESEYPQACIHRARMAFSAFPAAAAATPNATVTRFGRGRIHQSFLVAGSDPAFLLQRLNTHVFADPEALTRNVDLVARTVQSPLRLERTERDQLLHWATPTDCWRLLRFVPKSCPLSLPVTPVEAERAAEAFGSFSDSVASIPPSHLASTIPDFHNTPLRYQRLQQSVAAATEARRSADGVAAALSFLAERSSVLGIVEDARVSGRIPTRVAHNDAKLDNLVVHCVTGAPLAVVDLDTVMTGSPLHDLGDLLRSAAVTANEDERDLAKVGVDWDLAEAIQDGFLRTAHLDSKERSLAASAGWLMSVEQAIRYLTDFLQEDRYYGVEYPNQNLVRAQNQIVLAGSFEGGHWAPRG